MGHLMILESLRIELGDFFGYLIFVIFLRREQQTQELHRGRESISPYIRSEERMDDGP